MTYAVLTNQMTADKILNPGGFDASKKMGYMVAAFKNPVNNLSWEELQSKSIDDLKDLSYTEKDLTFADTQIQFYKQNSAAASLIGVFAVNKVAHATLEGNDIYLDVSEICGTSPFSIAGMIFEGRMQVDPTYDKEGNLIGKTLGSLVSASADAVKDPILNLMNVNMSTAGMLNTMLRLGMPFDDAALFLSQDVIERLLGQFHRENLANYVSLDSLIEKWLNKYKDKHGIDKSSSLETEELTKEELVKGLTSEEHESIDYKVLVAFQKVRSLVDAMRKPTFITRFNSISSAVGPLIVDNLIIEHKMEQFLSTDDDSTHFYTKDNVPVDANYIFSKHPILEQFSRTVGIAASMFSDMPAGNKDFRKVLRHFPKDIVNTMYRDKKLLDQLSNFYQSYLLVQSGMINPKHLKSYITGFPKWFIDNKIKEDYPDNELIKAIRANVSKKSGRPYLTINITGMDEQGKEKLRNAWVDLHKTNPELSEQLFTYSFFVAGVGFSPKTFMSLVPTFVKERLKSKDGSTSYVDTYRNFPEIVPKLVVDQFIRNNWNNNKLVPWKGDKDTHYTIDLKKGTLTAYRAEDIADLGDASYIKTKTNGKTYLWKKAASDNSKDLQYKMVKPLGNNGEYLEMSTEEITDPINPVIQVTENNEKSDMKDVSAGETSVEETANTGNDVRSIDELADLIMKQNPKLDKQRALELIKNLKGKEKMYAPFLQNVFKHKGIDLDREAAINEFKKYC